MTTTNIIKAAQALINDEIVAIPTETVYGLAGNAYSENALKKIFELKKRPFYNPLIVHIKSTAFLDTVASDIPDMAWKLAKEFWPGSLTLVLKKQPHIPDIVTAGKETVAVRVPNHPVALALLELLEFPLAAPSANPFGCISPTTAMHVSNYFKENLEIVLDGGACQNGIESTIIGFENDKPILYRHGSISIEAIERIVGKVLITTSKNSSPDAPGMLSRHYAPKTNTYLTDNVPELIPLFSGKKIGLLLFKDEITDDENIHQEVLSRTGDLAEAAKNLYATMHRLDKSNLDVIIAERLPNKGLGKSINDRLERAIKK
ncbi:L-threonylcarbamoyladenylate synthase [Flavobacterium sp. IMCC34518]|uniref:L-threonylcarbamoyladenylate synthase n=1 Tax=Flavobacterium sp. IMCC34518 TaxID=3003623 RepID=UPI0022AC7D89|nr:L-threonylcarbamoyladenylate synthase [Flavobacterium sp. IMCC34518]